MCYTNDITQLYFIIMSQKTTLTIITILLALVAIAMIIVGVKLKILAPAMTGIGFLLIVWALRILS